MQMTGVIMSDEDIELVLPEGLILNDDGCFTNESVDQFLQHMMKLIRQCQTSSNGLEGWQNFSCYKGVHLTMNKINYSICSLISKIYSHEDIKLNLIGLSLSKQLEALQEGNDALLERLGSDLDEAVGLTKNAPIADNTVFTVRGPMNKHSNKEMVLLASRNVQKPQVFFHIPVNNSSKEPFIPMINEKPNSLKPLSVSLCVDDQGNEYYSHPYQYELEHWAPHDSSFKMKDPIQPLHLPETSLIIIETEKQLQNAIKELKKCTEIAVDVENHHFRSYQGLTCLIQISSRQKDYLIDPFLLRGKLVSLNEVFTHPKITKVLHGADHDILWLQRDCGVYIVNMFDTHQASVALNYPHRSLAALLEKFCSVTVNKIYQRADWRIRPLPEDFKLYAREDTHYLLYIYDLLRNELLEKGNERHNLLNAVYSRSTEICLKRYEKPVVDEHSYLDLYHRSKKNFNNRQLFALKKLCLWRDKIARTQDESVEYVLPKHMMLQVAEVLPREVQGILACCNPVPACVKPEQTLLHQIVLEARSQPLDQPTTSSSELEVIPSLCNVVISSTSRHDLSQSENISLYTKDELAFSSLEAEPSKMKTNSRLFGSAKRWFAHGNSSNANSRCDFISPFERYKMSQKLFAEEQELKKQNAGSQPRVNESSADEESIPEPAPSCSDKGKQKEQGNAERRKKLKGKKIAEKRVSPSSAPASERSPSNAPASEIASPSNARANTGLRSGMERSVKRKCETGCESSLDEVTPYDYESADYQVFRRKQNKRKGKTFKEKFRSKYAIETMKKIEFPGNRFLYTPAQRPIKRTAKNKQLRRPDKTKAQESLDAEMLIRSASPCYVIKVIKPIDSTVDFRHFSNKKGRLRIALKSDF